MFVSSVTVFHFLRKWSRFIRWRWCLCVHVCLFQLQSDAIFKKFALLPSPQSKFISGPDKEPAGLVCRRQGSGNRATANSTSCHFNYKNKKTSGGPKPQQRRERGNDFYVESDISRTLIRSEILSESVHINYAKRDQNFWGHLSDKWCTYTQHLLAMCVKSSGSCTNRRQINHFYYTTDQSLNLTSCPTIGSVLPKMANCKLLRGKKVQNSARSSANEPTFP